jgi:hypothetical protein
MPLNEAPYRASQPDSWNFRKYHLSQDRGGQNAGTFMTSEAVLIAAGPPRLEDTKDKNIATVVVPVALTDNVSVSQNKLLQQIFEVGARRSYFVSGRTTGSLALSRPMFNGPSLLRLLVGNNGAEGLSNATDQEPGLLANGGTGVGIRPDENEAEFWINLQAEVFDRPLGLYLYMIDQRERPFGGMYVEDCMVQAHAFNLAAQGITVPENVSMMFDRIVPVQVRGAT